MFNDTLTCERYGDGLWGLLMFLDRRGPFPLALAWRCGTRRMHQALAWAGYASFVDGAYRITEGGRGALAAFLAAKRYTVTATAGEANDSAA